MAASSAIVHGFASLTSVTGRQPCTIWASPPWIFSTWPVIPSASGEASHTAPAAAFSGANLSKSPSFASKAPPPRSSVRRVRATGAMALTRTPIRSSSRASTIVMAAIPAFAAA